MKSSPTSTNYFLYIVTRNHYDPQIDIDFKVGQNGWGYTQLEPGIMDAPFGIMYVAPGPFVERKIPEKTRIPKGTLVKWAILEYFGFSKTKYY